MTEQHPDQRPPEPLADIEGIPDTQLLGDASDAARSMLGDQDPTHVDTDPLVTRLDEILATPVDINALSPALAERFESLTPEEIKKAFIAFAHEAVSTEVELIETKAELHQVQQHDQETTVENFHLRRRAETAEEKARFDRKTKLLNSEAFREEVEAETGHIHTEEDRNRKHTLVFGDIDDFKALNDAFGHPRVDEALIELADTLKGVVKSTDRVGRYGGEEIVMFFRDTPVEVAVRILERIRPYINAINVNGEKLGISFGVTGFRQGEEYLSVLERANAAEGKAKKIPGKNSTVTWEEGMENGKLSEL